MILYLGFAHVFPPIFAKVVEAGGQDQVAETLRVQFFFSQFQYLVGTAYLGTDG